MGSARAWPIALGPRGAVTSAEEGPEASHSLACRRSTGAPDDFGALPASPSARPRVRASAAASSTGRRRRLEHLDMIWTDNTTGHPRMGLIVPKFQVVRGGPQSSPAAAARDLAAGACSRISQAGIWSSGPDARATARASTVSGSSSSTGDAASGGRVNDVTPGRCLGDAPGWSHPRLSDRAVSPVLPPSCGSIPPVPSTRSRP